MKQEFTLRVWNAEPITAREIGALICPTLKQADPATSAVIEVEPEMRQLAGIGVNDYYALHEKVIATYKRAFPGCTVPDVQNAVEFLLAEIFKMRKAAFEDRPEVRPV